MPEISKEVKSLRSENSKTFDIGKDKRRLEAHIGAIHYKDNYADPYELWKDIDLNWEGNRINKVPYELTHEGNKLTLKNKRTDNITTIKLLDIGGKEIPEVAWERSRGLARAPGITTIDNVALDTDLEIIVEFSAVRFRRVLKSDKAPREAKFKVTGDTSLVRIRASDEDGDIPVESSLKDRVLTETLKPDRKVKYPVRIDPTWQVGASSDDVRRRLSDDAWSRTHNFVVAGASPDYWQYGSGMRFTNITIPKDAIINDGTHLTLKCASITSGVTVKSRISAEDVDNPATFADSSSAFDTRWANRTTARVDWDAIPVWDETDIDHDSPEIKTVIQEIVDRAGWQSGYGIVIFWEDFENRSTHSDYCMRRGYSYDNNSTYASKLVIDYTVPVVAPTVTTQAVSAIQKTTATGNGNITDNGGENCSRRGFCYKVGTSGDPTTADSVAYDDDGFGTGAYTKGLTGLSSGTNYRVRAYAVNSAGTGYGATVQMRTITEQVVGAGSIGMAGTLDRKASINVGDGAIDMASILIAIKKAFLNVGDGAVGIAGTLGLKAILGVGDGAIGIAGTLGRKIFMSVGAGNVDMAGTLSAIKKFWLNVGSGTVGIAGTLGLKIKLAVGSGSISMTGTLGRLIKIAVGSGTIGIAGTLGLKAILGVGDGAIGIAGSLGKKISMTVGQGAVALAGYLFPVFVLHYTVVKIDGVQVLIRKGSLLIDERIDERSIAEFTVWDSTAASHYQKGQPIEIYDTGNHLIFTGFIHTSEEKRVGVGSLFHYVRCADNHYLADKRIAAESYEDTLAGDIVKDLRTKYLDAEGVTAGTIQDGPTLKQVVINYVRVSEALDALAEKANFIWQIDELKKLHFLSRATNTAWWTATSSLIDHADLIHGNPLYRNRQYIRGGKAETSEQVETRTGDGAGDPVVGTVAFTMGYPLAKVPVITVTDRDPFIQTIGIKGIDTDKDFYWSKGDSVVTAAIAPLAGKTIEVTYVGEFNLITLSADDTAIADRLAVEGGGTGYVDNVYRDPNLSTLEAAFDVGGRKLLRYGVAGKKLVYDTYQRGLEPGQLQTVNYPLLNLNNAEMLIEAVKIRTLGKTTIYHVTALEGPEMGSWSKLFQELAEREKMIDRLTVGEEGLVAILVQPSEEWGWNEALDVTIQACPICGAGTIIGPALIIC